MVKSQRKIVCKDKLHMNSSHGWRKHKAAASLINNCTQSQRDIKHQKWKKKFKPTDSWSKKGDGIKPCHDLRTAVRHTHLMSVLQLYLGDGLNDDYTHSTTLHPAATWWPARQRSRSPSFVSMLHENLKVGASCGFNVNICNKCLPGLVLHWACSRLIGDRSLPRLSMLRDPNSRLRIGHHIWSGAEHWKFCYSCQAYSSGWKTFECHL